MQTGIYGQEMPKNFRGSQWCALCSVAEASSQLWLRPGLDKALGDAAGPAERQGSGRSPTGGCSLTR